MGLLILFLLFSLEASVEMAQGLHDTKAMHVFKPVKAARVFFLELEPVEGCLDIDGAGIESDAARDPTCETRKLDESAVKSVGGTHHGLILKCVSLVAP